MASLWQVLPAKGAEKGAGGIPSAPEGEEDRTSIQAASRAHETRNYHAENDEGK